METRANHVWVGAVTLVLLAALAAFIVWIARLNNGDQKQYDIFFKQSVSGLAKGSEVSFAGVPVGQVETIKLWEKRSRIRLGADQGEGRRAHPGRHHRHHPELLHRGFDDLARRRAPRPSADHLRDHRLHRRRADHPAQGRAASAKSSPMRRCCSQRLATLTERLTELLSDKNQASIAGILANTNKMTANLARRRPRSSARWPSCR